MSKEIDGAIDFECVHEKFPTSSPEVEQLFKYARWLQKSNQLAAERVIYNEVERLYRIAAENGHAKATLNLLNGALRGQFQMSSREMLRLSERLVEDGVASGYYLFGIYLQSGLGGLQADQEMSMRYFRRAADEGSARAQYFVGDKLDPVDMAPKVAYKMYRCAAEQGHAEAAVALAIYLKNHGEHSEALKVFQLGVANGSESAVGFLEGAFGGPPPEDKLYYLSQPKDEERVARYNEIWRVLANYSYAKPTVPEINEIVPLPPAQLPPWDGKLKWLEERRANIPPEKPSEALLHELSKAQGLDPATGRPLPGSPAFSKYKYPQNRAYSGQYCPENGYWQAEVEYPRTLVGEAVQYVTTNQILPLVEVEFIERRPWPFSNRVRRYQQKVDWWLMG